MTDPNWSIFFGGARLVVATLVVLIVGSPVLLLLGGKFTSIGLIFLLIGVALAWVSLGDRLRDVRRSAHSALAPRWGAWLTRWLLVFFALSVLAPGLLLLAIGLTPFAGLVVLAAGAGLLSGAWPAWAWAVWLPIAGGQLVLAEQEELARAALGELRLDPGFYGATAALLGLFLAALALGHLVGRERSRLSAQQLMGTRPDRQASRPMFDMLDGRLFDKTHPLYPLLPLPAGVLFNGLVTLMVAAVFALIPLFFLSDIADGNSLAILAGMDSDGVRLVVLWGVLLSMIMMLTAAQASWQRSADIRRAALMLPLRGTRRLNALLLGYMLRRIFRSTVGILLATALLSAVAGAWDHAPITALAIVGFGVVTMTMILCFHFTRSSVGLQLIAGLVMIPTLGPLAYLLTGPDVSLAFALGWLIATTAAAAILAWAFARQTISAESKHH